MAGMGELFAFKLSRIGPYPTVHVIRVDPDF